MSNPIYPNSDEALPFDAQWGVSRGAGEFEIPRVHLNSFWSCIYICITLLNIHTKPGLWITQLVSRASWYRYHHDITRPRTHWLASDMITPIPNVPPIIFRFLSNNGHCGGIKINNEVLSLRPFLHSAKEIHFWLDIGWYLISLAFDASDLAGLTHGHCIHLASR